MDTKTYAQALVDYAGISASEVSDYLDGSNPGIDWTDQMFRTGVTQNYKLVFSKGSEGTQTYVSANYMGDEGVIDKNIMNVIRLKPTLRSLWLNGWMLLSI